MAGARPGACLFKACLVQVPLETLSSELQKYVTVLKGKLVEVINEDYNDFVSLSTKLVNVDGVVTQMQKPLLSLKVLQGAHVFTVLPASSSFSAKLILLKTDVSDTRTLTRNSKAYAMHAGSAAGSTSSCSSGA